MGNEGIDVSALQPIALEESLADFGHFADGVLEHRSAVLVDVMHPLVNGFVARGVQAAASGHVQRTSSGTVDLVDEVDQPEAIAIGWFEDDGASPVAKNNASRPIGVVDDRRH